RIPEALANARRLAEAREPVFHGQPRIISYAVLCLKKNNPHDAKLIAERQAAQPQQAGDCMQWRGQSRAFKGCVTLLTIQEINPRARLKSQAVETANLLEEGDRLPVTAHEEVLAVIDDIAGLLIDERVGAPAEMPAPFQQRHRRAAFAQFNARR